MTTKIISPKTHGLVDYALAGSLLIVPTVCNFPKDLKQLYAIEAIILLGYVALTNQPAAIKPVIPFGVHRKIDPFNVAQFALQTFFKPFRKNRKARVFNISFTIAAGLLVALTDWNGRTKTNS